MVTIVIPARNEMYLMKTIIQVLGTVKEEDVELLVMVDAHGSNEDGKVDAPMVELMKKQTNDLVDLSSKDSRVKVFFHHEALGQRVLINKAFREAKYDRIFKLDGHCFLSHGWLQELNKVYDEDVFLTTRMFNIEEGTWARTKRRFDFAYLNQELKSKWWMDYGKRVEDEVISETMSFMGTTWFVSKALWNKLGGYDEKLGSWGNTGSEWALKVWLTGHRMLVHKGVWCAHLYRTTFPYSMKNSPHSMGNKILQGKYLFSSNTCTPGAKEGPPLKHSIAWLLGKFWPVPTWAKTPPPA